MNILSMVIYYSKLTKIAHHLHEFRSIHVNFSDLSQITDVFSILFFFFFFELIDVEILMTEEGG